MSVCKTLLGKAPSPLPLFAHKRGHGRQEDRQKQSCSGRVSESRHRQSGMSPWKEAASEPAPPAWPPLRPPPPASSPPDPPSLGAPPPSQQTPQRPQTAHRSSFNARLLGT